MRLCEADQHRAPEGNPGVQDSRKNRRRKGRPGAWAWSRDSHLRIIEDYVGEANPEGHIILYYRMVAVEYDRKKVLSLKLHILGVTKL